jgi:hypothetical protein
MLKPFCSFSLPGTVASFSAEAGIGGGATGASFIAASVFGRPISGEPGGNGAAAAPAAGGAGVCCAAAGHARSVAKVVASRSARRVEYPLVMWSSLTRSRRSLRWFTADACGAAPSHPVSDFCNRSAIALRPPHWLRAVLCDKARAKSRKHAAT